MAAWRGTESGSDRVALAKDAGMGRLSLFGILAGTLVAYGAFLVLLAIAAAVADALDVTTKISTLNWEQLGVTGGLVVAGVLFLAYLFGGYVAGRMARRAGAINGFLVFVLGILLPILVALLVNLITDSDAILGNLRTAGIPTTGSEWGEAGTVAGIASLVAIVLGPILGGILGERWHAKLVRRAVDPSVGPQARAREDADRRQWEAEQRTSSTAPPPPPPREDEPTRVGSEPEPRQEPQPARESGWSGGSRPWAGGASGQEQAPGARPPEAGREEGGPRVTRRPRPLRPR